MDDFWKSNFGPFWQLTVNSNSKFNTFLWVCWFFGKNLSNFVSSDWKLHNPYCHTAVPNILQQVWKSSTLYKELLRIARNLLETRENIKIESCSFYHIIFGWFSWGSSQKKIFFEKKNPKWPIFKIANSQNFFVKISWMGPWVSRIDWCKGHWFISTYMAKGKNSLKAQILHFLPVFALMLDSLTAI